MSDPSRWQPLALSQFVAQNGLPTAGSVQRFVGPHWGHVDGFALPASADGLPADPGPPPRLGPDPAARAAFGEAAVEVLRASSSLDPADGVTVDIGPGATGDNPLGTNGGDGHERNPETGEPYASNLVLRADFARVLTEFWADGPESETPPGHWNALANEVSDTPGLARRIGGEGRGRPPGVGRQAVPGPQRRRARRGGGRLGRQGSVRHRPADLDDPLDGRTGPVQRPGRPGVPPGRAPAGRRPGRGRHAEPSAPASATSSSPATGEVAVHAWRGPAGRRLGPGGRVGAVPAVDVRHPGVAGYVSGHSTFSRAAAEVMTSFTGSPYFPGGLAEWSVPPAASASRPVPPTT